MGCTVTAITFSYFLTKTVWLDIPTSKVKESDYISLGDFRMEIIEEIKFFFFNVEDPASEAMRRNDAKIDKQGTCIAKKRVKNKGYTLHRVSTETFQSLFRVVIRGVFRTQSNICDETFLGK